MFWTREQLAYWQRVDQRLVEVRQRLAESPDDEALQLEELYLDHVTQRYWKFVDLVYMHDDPFGVRSN